MKKNQMSENALAIAKSRYFMDDEDWDGCALRVANTIASAELNNRDQIRDNFYEMIYNMDFLPGGRILRNSARPRGSLFNCYHLPIGDSIEEIGQFYMDALTLWSEGGGVGVNFTPLRPRDDVIHGKGGKSSGLVSFMKGADHISRLIESGGSRRAAAIGHIDVTHPELLDFIDAKLSRPDIGSWLKDDAPEDVQKYVRENVDVGDLTHFNISVMVNNDFLEAVESDSDWTFKFKQKSYDTVKARMIWDKIVKNMVDCAEPGLINWSTFTKNNSYYFEPVLGTNPCLTGDTLIAVADGRNYVPIKQLAEEGKDVPVYALNTNDEICIEYGRNPRMTGKKREVWKLTLDDGSIIKATPNHKFIDINGNQIELKDLKVGTSLRLNNKHRKEDGSGMETYWHFTGKNTPKCSYEHTMIFNFFNKENQFLPNSGYHIHHKDFNKINNNKDNLQKLLKDEHLKLHQENMFGEKNPMNRYPERNWLIKQDWSGEHNGRYKGFDGQQLFEIAKEYSEQYNRRLTKKEWEEICRTDGLPIDQVGINQKKEIEFVNDLLKYAAIDAGVFVYESSSEIRYYKEYLKIKEETDLDIFFDKGILVRKKCEKCDTEFITSWGLRERAYCGRSCANKGKTNDLSHYEDRQKEVREKQIRIYNDLKFNIGRDPLKKEWMEECKNNNVSARIRSRRQGEANKHCFYSFKEVKEAASDFNHKVVGVEFYGYEDVYNITTDNVHNFGIAIPNEKNTQVSVIFTKNCGETTLGPYGVCDLGSLVLPNFITGNVNTNWKKLEQTIRMAVRFLDNVIEVNKYVLKKIDINAHKSRRVGVGVIGLAEYLFAKKVRYGSHKAVQETERLMRFIRDACYQASLELAVEKGAFPQFEPVAYGKASFIRKLPAQLRMDIKKHGVRNCTIMALAPTGTISLLADYTSAIEPLFAKAMMRKDRISERMYIHPKYQEIIERGEETPEWFVDSFDLEPSDHFEMQVACQKYCDASVSKTINLPKETTDEDLSALLLEYIYDLKGCTVYRDGSRVGQILNKVSDKDAREYVSKQKDKLENNLTEDQVKCSNGTCDM